MSQSACGFRFTSKACDKLIVRRELRMDDFDRDGPFCAEMRGAIDGAHSSLSEELFDLVFVIECVHVSGLKICSFCQILIGCPPFTT